MFRRILNINEENKTISGLNLDLKSIYINELSNLTKKNILIVSDNYFNSYTFHNNLLNYSEKAYFFPVDDFGIANYETVSPELELIRSNTIGETFKNKYAIYVTDLKGYLRKIISPEQYLNSIIKIKKNQIIKQEDLITKLIDIGFVRESIVTKIGEYSSRGFVIDLYPIDSDPIRIEFWGDEVTSIKRFEVDSQRSYEEIEEVTINPVKPLNFGANEDSIISFLKEYILILDETKKIDLEYEKIFKQDNFSEYYFEYKIRKDAIIFDNINDLLENNRVINYDVKTVYNLEKTYIDFIKNISNINKTVFLCFKNTKMIKKVISEINDTEIYESSLLNFKLNKLNVIEFGISESFEIDDYLFVSEKTLFNKKDEKYVQKSNSKIGNRVRDLSKLEIGDYVVHDRYGIGVYKGLKTITKDSLMRDYIQIDYKGNDKLYVPVEKIDLISKYSSKEGYVPKVNKLGSLEWEKAKINARKRAKNMAIDLLKLYSSRENAIGYSFPEDTEEQIIFESEFMFNETKDQLRTIEEVKADMQRSRPMDRIICGDVGFGKTEVAFRAAFKAVMASKQVVFLCPTTILSRQHYLNAIERFKSFPIRIELLNRFVSKKQQEKIINDFKFGKVDIIIGTHRVLSQDIKAKDLGLLIIDEEQRFGVTHKERIKEFKNNVDILTLSATPIPRTVQMSLSGIKNLSLIETPPTNRLPIQTYVLEENIDVIKTAIYKEISRGGQVFILNNQIKDMESKLKEISELVPDAKVCYAHGRMSKTELENIMLDFVNKEYNVLISTTIIETGIDIPSANTLIILDADKFGLSQLYQIRGRVGRSANMAYCFLMYKKGKTITDVAVKRLKAIKEFTELGSGFSIAMRDLSIRGAGDILGSEQAGFIDTVGIEMFIKLLNQEVSKLKGIQIEEEEDEKPLINVETAISDKYVSDEEMKIEIHKKITSIDSYESLEMVKEELIDRFGLISREMEIYMYQEWFEKYANKLGVREIRQNKREIEIVLTKEQTNLLNGEKLFLNIIGEHKNVRFNMKFKRLAIIINLLQQEKHFIFTLIDILKALENSLM